MTDTDNIDTENETNNTESEFIWPEPGEDWWMTKGAMFRLDDETIRFSAHLHALGGSRARRNSQAAKNAGLDWNRVDAFRVARSAGVARLLDEADKIKKGRLPSLTEEDIDREVDDLIRTKDPLTKARGIELREKRKVAKQSDGATDDALAELKVLSKVAPDLALRIAKKHRVADKFPELEVKYVCPTCGAQYTSEPKIKDVGNGHVDVQ
jgi:hypothetical protein